MSQSNLVAQCETFRQSVMLSINNLDISEQQKQVFLLNFQAFYLQMLQQLSSNIQTIE